MATLTVQCNNQDGNVYAYGTTYSTVRSASSGTVELQSNVVGQQKGGPVYRISRLFLAFDTSALPDTCTISAAKLRLCCETDSSDTDFDVTVYEGQQGPALETTDYNDFGSTSFGTWNTVNYSDENYIEITLNSDGRTAISKTGVTYFCLRSSRDVGNTTPTGNEYLQFRASDDSGKEPKLEITYSAAGTEYEGTLADTINLTGTDSGVRAFNASLADSITLAGVDTALVAFQGSLADTTNLSESDSSTGDPNLNFSETINLSEVFSGNMTREFDGSLADTINLSESYTVLGSFYGSISDSVELTETYLRSTSDVPSCTIALKFVLSDSTEVSFCVEEVLDVVDAPVQDSELFLQQTTAPYFYVEGEIWKIIDITFMEARYDTRSKIEQIVDDHGEMTVYYAYDFWGTNKSTKVILKPHKKYRHYYFGDRSAFVTQKLTFYEYEK